MARGRLIVIEGAEGVGKTTQLRLLGDWLNARRIPHVGVREPGGTALGTEIRRLLLDPARSITPRAEALLFMASRAELVGEVIRPALERGEVVLADRFFLSTYAYQVAGRGLPMSEVRAANAFATGGVRPDVTFVLDAPRAVRRARLAQRPDADRIERSGDAFHERVSEALRTYLTPEWQREHAECGPLVEVDASASAAKVHERIIGELTTRWPETFSALSESNR